MSRFLIPSVMLTFALLSLVILRSVAPDLVVRQLIYFVLGGGVFWGVARLPFSFWRSSAVMLFAILILGLCTTQAVGRITRGTRSWIPVGNFHIQPSQVAIVASGLMIIRLVSKKRSLSLRDIYLLGGVFLLPAVLIFTEPDLGTTIVYLASVGGMLFLCPIRLKHVLLAVLASLAVSLLAWNFLLRDEQKVRITSFLNTTQDLQGAGYNAWQSLIAVGSGGVFGRGIGHGVQSQLRFLPERQTDFIFASLTEEMGLVVGAVVIILYATLSIFCFLTGVQSSDLGRSLWCYLCALFLCVQAGINIGMNMGLLPITGITLPFLSYGGSSILSLSLQFGIVQSIVWRRTPRAALYIH